MNQILSEKDLENIFYDKKSIKHSGIAKFFLFIAVFFAFSALIYGIINFRSLYSNIDFWYKNEYSVITESEKEEIVLPRDITKTEPTLPEIANNSIYIPQINIKAPINWNIDNDSDAVSRNLEKGVIHLSGTATPGQKGNVFITGHSSNYPWARGSYNNVFSLINKLVAGDLIQVKHNDKNYLYKVSDIKVVKPTDVSVLEPTKDPILSLMTCTPVGTSINRLVIISKQVYPDPNTASASVGSGVEAAKLPKVR